jgi:sortase A
MNAAVDRGGPFVRDAGTARNWMRAAAPGIGFRFMRHESSPIGSRRRVPVGELLVATIVLLTLAGCAALAHGLWIVTKAYAGQGLLQVAWKRTQDQGAPAKPWPWADMQPIARLTVPARHTTMLVLAGANGRTLAWGPGHLDGSAQPGATGHAVITAHRDTHFAFLEKVAIGDAITIERADGTRVRYRVVATAVADHRALRLPRDVAVPTLTLVTCWPFDAIAAGGPLRYVVTAEAG